jgi:hypothetical protein
LTVFRLDLRRLLLLFYGTGYQSLQGASAPQIACKFRTMPRLHITLMFFGAIAATCAVNGQMASACSTEGCEPSCQEACGPDFRLENILWHLHSMCAIRY